MKHVNQFLVNAPQKKRLQITMNTLLINNEKLCGKQRKNGEKKIMKISRPQYESEKANKVNNEPKVNVDKQQDDIKHLK